MKKIFSLLIFLLISTNVFASSCPSLMKEIDKLIGESKALSKEQLEEIKQLRIQGEEAHKSGDHKESEALLKQALDLLDN